MKAHVNTVPPDTRADRAEENDVVVAALFSFPGEWSVVAMMFIGAFLKRELESASVEILGHAPINQGAVALHVFTVRNRTLALNTLRECFASLDLLTLVQIGYLDRAEGFFRPVFPPDALPLDRFMDPQKIEAANDANRNLVNVLQEVIKALRSQKRNPET